MDETRTFDLIIRAQVTIARPVQEVWPRFLKIEDWMENLRFQRVSGAAGQEGEVRLVTSTQEGTAYPAYFITAVRVVPFEQYVLKVRPQTGGAYFGFADFSFESAPGAVRVIYDIYNELNVPAMSDQAFREFAAQQHDAARLDIARNNRNLKALAEQGA